MRIKLPKIVPAGFNVLKPAAEVTRQQRRHAKIKVKGQEVEILEYLRKKANSLPKIIDRGTNEPINHYEQLRSMYLIRGITGVNQYLHAVRHVYIRDTGGIVRYQIRMLKYKINAVLDYFNLKGKQI